MFPPTPAQPLPSVGALFAPPQGPGRPDSPEEQQILECQGKLQGLKKIPLECFNSGRADQTCREEPSVSMRLLYRRTSQSLPDPRVGRQDDASTSQHTAAKILQTQGGGAEWDLDTIISTGSAINMVRVVPGDNPNLQTQDSDHEDDIECLD